MSIVSSLYPVKMVEYFTNAPYPSLEEVDLDSEDERLAERAPGNAYAFRTFQVLVGLAHFRGMYLHLRSDRFEITSMRYLGGTVYSDVRLNTLNGGEGMVHSTGSRVIDTRFGLRSMEPDAIVIQA